MSVNKVILLGNVGKDPEVKEFSDGGKVANFSLATTERAFKLQNGTEIPEKTEWHNLTVKGGLAKVAEQYVKKGTKLYVEGKIRTRSYETNGEKRYITEIHVSEFEMLGGNQSSEAPAAPTEEMPF